MEKSVREEVINMKMGFILFVNLLINRYKEKAPILEILELFLKS